MTIYKLKNTKCKYCDVFIPQLNGTRRNVCRPCACQNSHNLIHYIDYDDV